MADVAFPLNSITILELRPEPYIHICGGHHLSLHRQHPTGGRDGGFQISGDRRQGRKEQVAEAVAFQPAAGGEAVLEEAGEQGFFGGERCKAVADVPGWKHPQLPPQSAAAAAVVGHGDDGGDVAAVTLQATQEGRETGAAADGHDVGAAVEAALGAESIHQHRVLVWGEGLLDRPETAALPPEHQAGANDQHQGAGDFARQHGGDCAEKPAEGFENPVDRFEVRPDRGPQQGHHQAEPRGQHPAFDHQTRLQPADSPLGARHQVPPAIGPQHPGLTTFAVRCDGRQGPESPVVV